jgi:hypothetical protein
MKRTPQYLFDRVVRQMIAQGGPSVSESGFCCYRGPGGRKCAVGAVLPDEAYFSDMEDTRVDHLADMEPPIEKAAAFNVWVEETLRPNLDLLASLQDAHDNRGDLDGILRAFRTVASFYNLDTAVLDEVAHA